MDVEWQTLLAPDTPPLEIFVRGSVMYLALFALLRLVLKRQSGTVGVSDLLVIVLLADASQNGLAGDYTSIADGLLLVVTILFWSFAIDALGYRFPALQRLISPPPLTLVRRGQMLRKNMRQELITESELLSQLRLQGVEQVEDVELACMEPDGRISVVSKSESRGAERPRV